MEPWSGIYLFIYLDPKLISGIFVNYSMLYLLRLFNWIQSSQIGWWIHTLVLILYMTSALSTELFPSAIYVCMCICIYMYLCIYIYTHIYTYIHTHIYNYVYRILSKLYLKKTLFKWRRPVILWWDIAKCAVILLFISGCGILLQMLI